jgi:hypothetical protein
MNAMTEPAQDLGPLLEKPVPVHFIGGPWCGLTAQTRMAGEVWVISEQLSDRKRTHVYRRTGRIVNEIELLMHREIRDERRGDSPR